VIDMDGFSENIRQVLAVLPDKPGVYLMRDAAGKVIYVGKAVVLKNRVRSYFRKLSSHSPKVAAMTAKVADIETIVTTNEVEALILECNLIKKYRPRYNISLKDDKTYPLLKVTVMEEFPRVFATRRHLRDGAKYYGPYADAGAMHAALSFLRGMFPLRTCRKMNARPCLNYHIKKCLAPCAGLVSRKEYGNMIKSVCMVLDGRTRDLERDLKKSMKEASESYAFEEAARLRDQLKAITKLNEEQKAVTDGGDMDVIGFARAASGICLELFFVRKGKLIDRDKFFFADGGETEEEIVTAFVKQYYGDAAFIAREIAVHALPQEEELPAIKNWLSERAGRKVDIISPSRGVKKDLIKMANDNAAKLLEERFRKGQLDIKNNLDAAEELQKALGFGEPLSRMDCFDISHTQGAETVASMVVFRDGSMSKKDYRRYKIISAEGKPDDFKSMQEVVYRRYRKYEDLPSLIVIDGGKGQLSSALEVIRGLGIDVPVIGLAKREEEIFKEGQKKSILLDRDSAALHLIQRIRDEAHRFAITYHRKLRGKRNLVSVLDHVEGIGPKRCEALRKVYKTLDEMKAATAEELAAVEGMNSGAAEKLYNFFRLDLPEKKEMVK